MTDFEILEQIISSRRMTKPTSLNGKIIDDTVIEQLLQLADWAPTHARTEPWRFIIFSGNKVQQFCTDHAELYKKVTPEEKFNPMSFDKIIENGKTTSHIIAVYMKRTENAKIPAHEEAAAVACAINNILLGCAAAGIAVLWSTGGLTYNPALKEYFNLNAEDEMMGLLFLGYTDEPKRQGSRKIAMSEKAIWK